MQRLSAESALALADNEVTALKLDSSESALASLMSRAAAMRDQADDGLITYSRKIFIPLTQLCRNVCHYCTFAQPPRTLDQPFMSPEQVLEIARQGAAAGCNEALFTLGDKPELRYRAAREALVELGYESTAEYLIAMARLVFEETGLLPHLNPGVMDEAELLACREVSVSQGMMLESVSERLCEKGEAHYGSPDKKPAVRLRTLRLAGELNIPYTSGILIGIGETRRERIESLLALRDIQDQYGHIQEIIIQNFCAKPGTLMADKPDAPFKELLWTIAVARLIFGPDMPVQTPPNLNEGILEKLIAAGISDWGGVSPITPDFVNPEKPWPSLEKLAQQSAEAGKVLVERLPIYPVHAFKLGKWIDPALHKTLLQGMDSDGLARRDQWNPGSDIQPPNNTRCEGWQAEAPKESADVRDIIERALAGERLDEPDITRLFRARGNDFQAICDAADTLRSELNGDTVTYAVNRNINYTNICTYTCKFCAFSKGKTTENLRGKPYVLDVKEVVERSEEAWRKGATEVCLQGGIHPDYTGDTYHEICAAIHEALPDMHIHAFSPLEISQGAETLGLSLEQYLTRMKEAGLNSLPGTAAEILDDEVRDIICPDKLKTDEWLEVIETAHKVGIRTTSTIMFGHVDRPEHWARHLLRLRDLQARSGGITEFVPLPFVPMEAPIYRRGKSRRGPTFRESVLMHAVSRLALYPHITNIQASWVKLGEAGVTACLQAGANDMGGTLMNESISRAAGASHGQEMTPERMAAVIESLGRNAKQRTTFYGDPQQRAGFININNSTDCQERV
ncbi:MAG: 5-amino-6-(D-ribitylamino)uracil--L-tyrosine 4-hydroxyphenyl transferase CofH [Porticoccaceae bacterium]|nr:5-amino-6-(D-ribitylamino)uracil--L-tyrosine 4-hydroxyphenyl transferase CofH [Porticoccaceae bacterium]